MLPHFPGCPIPMHYASSLAFGILLTICLRSWLLRHAASSNAYPPSPPGDPLIGHARKIPGTHPWMTFSRWAKRYGESSTFFAWHAIPRSESENSICIGDVIYLHVLGRPIILVSSMKVARDLMDKNGANYSDRPNMTLLTEM